MILQAGDLFELLPALAHFEDNPQLKQVFKGASQAALHHEAIKAYYQRLISSGVKPELARGSVVRKLASIALTVRQRREEFDAKKAFAQD